MEKAGGNTASSGSLKVNVNIPRPKMHVSSNSPSYASKTFAYKKASNEYLKNVFPGGFNLKNSKGDLVVRENSLIDQSLQSSPSQLYENSFGSIRDINTNTLTTKSTLKPPSGTGLAKLGAQDSAVNDKTFFSWTKGTFPCEGDDSTNMTDTGLSDDPFGNVAGQYISSRERMTLGSWSSTLRTIKPYEVEEGTPFIGVLTAYEKKLSTPHSKHQSIRTSSLSSRGGSREIIYKPPSILGALERPKSCAVYDSGVYTEWLSSTRQSAYDVDRGMSKSAGGRISANKGGASASPVKGLVLPSSPTRTAPASNTRGKCDSINDDTAEFFVPVLPSASIDVEIYQYKNIIKTTKVSKFKVVAKMTIPAHISLPALKRILVDVDLQNNFSAVLSFDVMAFYFNNNIKAWKELKTALDLDHALLIANDLKLPMKVMYTCMKNRDITDAVQSQYSQNNSRATTMSSKEGQSRGSNWMTLKTAALLYDDSGLFGDDESNSSYSVSNTKSQASVDSKNVYRSKNHNYSPSILLIPPGPRASSPDHTVISKFNGMTVKPNFKKQEQLAMFLQQKLLKTKW